MKARNVSTWIMAALIAGACLASVAAQAQSVGPLINTTAANARVIVPDGTSLLQADSTGTRWFVFGVEPGKTYAVEVVDPASDLVANTIGSVTLSNGSGSPPPEANVDCTANTRAPALEVASDGIRCIVQTLTPAPGNTQNKRGVYVAVASVTGPSFQIRVRESTIYSRWTTNGYDFHVELQNTTADSVCVQVTFYPNAGDAYAGTWSGGLSSPPLAALTIPPFGANKYVLPNGTLVGTANDNRGTMRLGACNTPVNFVPSAIHVSTFAYNPVTDKFLYFFVNTANNGATSNSW